VKDIMWFNPGGTEMNDDEWTTGFVRTLGMLLSGDTIDVADEHGEPIHDDTFLMLLNAFHEPLNFVLPGQEDVRWELILDTQNEAGFLEPPQIWSAGDDFELGGRTFCLMKLSVGEQSHARAESWKKFQARQKKPESKTGKKKK
jgi:glycogen operon protein